MRLLTRSKRTNAGLSWDAHSDRRFGVSYLRILSETRLRLPIVCWTMAAGLCFAQVTSHEAGSRRWPSFLPPRESVPDAPVVEHLWLNRTFQRSFSPPVLNVPIILYAALIDSPDVLAAAARARGIAHETAEHLDDGSYELLRPDGFAAIYRVLVSEPNKRIALSYGHVVLFGVRVKGAVLGILDLRDQGDGIRQHVTAYAHVENKGWALVTKFILALLPSIADTELSAGFRMAGDVATWALRERGAFCAWLKGSHLESARVAAAAGCSSRTG